MKKIFMLTALIGLAFSTPVLASEIRVCSGKPGGNYDYTAKVMKQQMGGTADVVNINTKGSWENLEKINAGECDVAIVQSDALYLWTKEEGNFGYFSVSDLYTEYAHLLCNRKSNVKEFYDLNQSTKVFSGGKGTGADVTIRGLKSADAEEGDNRYAKVPLLNEESDDVALVKVKSRVADCLFYVGSRGNKFLSVNGEKLADDLVLVPIVDKDFNDVTMKDVNGNEMSVWSPREMDAKTYNKIMPSGVFGNKDLNTISVTAGLIASEKWVNENPEEFGSLGLMINDVTNIVRADRKLELAE